MRNPFQRCKCDENQFLSSLSIMVDGLLSILDGFMQIISLGFFATYFAFDFTVWRTTWQMNRKIKADKGDENGRTY